MTLVVTSLFQNWIYQGRNYICDGFFSFLKLQKILIDSLGQKYRRVAFKDTCFYRQPLVAQAYYNKLELSNFEKIAEIRGTQS